MNLAEFFSKGWPTRLGFYMGKYLPPHAGRHVAAVVSRFLVTIKPSIYHIAYGNLQHVLGDDISQREMKRLLYSLFLNVARGYYELFHNIGWGRVQVSQFTPPVRLRPEAQAYIQSALDTGRGLFFLGAHMSNFDLAGMALCQHMPVSTQVLSVAEPPPGFEVFNTLRTRGGIMVTPVNPPVLRQAMGRLRDGGAVITGVDHPIGKGDNPVEFFGDTAYLPTGYIRIPLITDCLVMTVTSYYESGIYWIVANPPMEMEHTGDRKRDCQINLRRVLKQVETLILGHPEQWRMFTPVWKGRT